MVRLQVYADFDGVLVEPERDIDQELKEVLEEVERSDPKELEREVYEEFTLLLCKSCRDRFVDEVKHPWGKAPVHSRRSRPNSPLRNPADGNSSPPILFWQTDLVFYLGTWGT